MAQRPSQNSALFQDLILNLALPSLALEHLDGHHGYGSPLIALLIGLSFPIIGGLLHFKRTRKFGILSSLGLLNVLVSGGFALMKLEGKWFALKESTLPLLLGIGILWSLTKTKSAFEGLLTETQLFNFDKFKESPLAMDQLKIVFKLCTFLFALSFFGSAIMNYFLAKNIFIDIPAQFTEVEKARALTSQISEMNWKGFLILLLPNLVMMWAILLYFIFRVKKIANRYHLDPKIFVEDQNEQKNQSDQKDHN